jgi:hypothetical protein
MRQVIGKMRLIQADIVVRYNNDPGSPYDWTITKKITIDLSNGDPMFIPAGFVTDFATVPRILWGIFPPIGRFNLAPVIHDFMYTYHNYNKKFADREFYNWLRYLCPENYVRNWLMYKAVCWFGGPRWKRYFE